jgi:2-amino-4-hydroxy-6-hydroxymethyldihydropteridine diphosphokinase
MNAYLGLGSNRGDRVGWLRAGVTALRARGLEIDACSRLWLSEPVGDASLPWFVNCVVQVASPPPPHALLKALLAAEEGCGRVRRPGVLLSRTFDADILLYDSRVMDEAELEVPHPRMCERRFVLNPLAELAPDLIHPANQRSIVSLRDELVSAERAWLLAPGLI